LTFRLANLPVAYKDSALVANRKGDGSMPTYITLYKLTKQGAQNIKDAPERIEKGIKAFEGIGGKIVGFYATMGEYDYVAIGEAPNDEIAMTFMLGQVSLGNVKTTTMKAFSTEAFAEMVKKLP
jgi:uncharacterized protein with GYD domain